MKCNKCHTILSAKNLSQFTNRINTNWLCRSCGPKTTQQYARIHRKLKSKYMKHYWLVHPEKNRAYRKTYYRKHKKQHLAYTRRWQQENPEKQKVIEARSRKSPKRLEYKRIAQHERKKRLRTEIILNDWFPGAQLHHILNGIAIYIPTPIHRSIQHSLFKYRKMFEINTKAISWWLEHFRPFEVQHK